MEKEEWRDVVGFETLYMVSNLGRIKRLDYTRSAIWRGMEVFNTYPEKILKGIAHRQGYKIYELSIKHGKRKQKRTNLFAHRAVAVAFIPNPENKKEVNHKNGIKDDNSVGNLEWVTPSENMRHAYRTGLNVAKKGEKHQFSTITDETAKRIKERAKYLPRTSDINIGIEFGVSRSMVWAIRTNRTWKHV